MKAGALLGTITKSASPPPTESGRERRWALLSVVRNILPSERVHWCCRRLAWEKNTVDIWKMNVGGKAHYKNLEQCGSVWTCPVCSAKISKRRGAELSEGVIKSKKQMFMITFTLQHTIKSDLDTLLDDLVDGVRFMLSGAPARRFKDRFRIAGNVSDLEHTWSFRNGHHPHKHILFLTDLTQEELNRADTKAGIENFTARYGRYLEEKGYLVNDHTVEVTTNRKDLETYLTKWALSLEVTAGQLKDGLGDHYTPFQLLGKIRRSDGKRKARMENAFREYAKAFKGRRQLVYSRGLRELLELKEEKSDADLVEETDEPSYLFAVLYWDQYEELLKRERTGILGKVLDVSSSGSLADLWLFLESIGIKVIDYQWSVAKRDGLPDWVSVFT